MDAVTFAQQADHLTQTIQQAAYFNETQPGNHSSYCVESPVVVGIDYPNQTLLAAARVLDGYEVMQVILMSVVILASVIGNVGVILVFCLTPTIRSSLNCYLVNLAVADLLITTLCWPTIVSRITSPLYLLSRLLCRLNILVQGTCVNVSVLTLGAVACNRAYAVLLPLRAHSAVPRLLPLLVVVWVVSFALAFPGFHVRDTIVYQWNDVEEVQCTDLPYCRNWSPFTYHTYRILVLCTMFFLPGLLMLVGYSVIVVRLWCMRKVPCSPQGSHQPHYHIASPPTPHVRVRLQIVKMTAIVLLVFASCWAPLHFLWLYDIINPPDQSRQWMEAALFWAYFLGYCNSALNPLLYWGFSDNFRGGLRALLTRVRLRAQIRVGQRRPPSATTSTSTLLSRISRQTSSSFSRKSSGGGLHTSGSKGQESTQRIVDLPKKASCSTKEV